MKNVINQLLRDLYFKIPPEVLSISFQRLRDENQLTNDAVIKEYIIEDHVLANCNLYAGKPKKIVLYEQYGKNIQDNTFAAVMSGNYGIYQIPPEARENRIISAVLDIAYPTTMALYGTFPNEISLGRSVANSVDEVLTSFTGAPIYLTPTPVLIDGESGIVGLSPPAALPVDWILSCMLGYDKDFSNISANMLASLKSMTEHATKSYIYNEMYVKINQGFLQGGLQLESIKGIIESYSDSKEKFEEALMKFRGAAVFSPEVFRDMLSMMIGG